MKKLSKKQLILINIFLSIILVILVVSVFLGDSPEDITQAPANVENIIDKENEVKEIKEKPKEDLKNDGGESKFRKKLENDDLHLEYALIEKDIRTDFERSRVEIDHVQIFAYEENGERYYHVLVFESGFNKTIHALLLQIQDNKVILIDKEFIQNARII